MVNILMAIDGYSIGGYWYYISGYWWLFY
jgi:hypothetical protein